MAISNMYLTVVLMCAIRHFGSFRVFGSPTSVCHDGDVDLIFVSTGEIHFLDYDFIAGYFAEREPNATGDVRIAILKTFPCKILLEFTNYTSAEQVESKRQDLLEGNFDPHCDKFSFLREQIEKSGEKKTFVVWLDDFEIALGVIRRFQNLNNLFQTLYHVYMFNFYDPYFKPQPNIHYHMPDNDFGLIGAKFCRVCSRGWIPFTSPKKPHVSSCYYLDVRRETISWIQARNECRYKGSLLVSFETFEEMEHVLNSLKLNDVQPLEDTAVYIGLISKRDTGVNTLSWTSGGPFTLPMKYTENLIGNYDLEMCIVLKCVTANNMLGKNNTSKPCTKQNIELLTLSCLQKITNLFICELEMASELNRETDRIKIPSLETNINNTEFVKIRNNIVSVSSKEHHSPEFKFDCGDNLQPVPYSAVCNKVFDCYNGRDEEYCYEKPQRKTYADLMFMCLTLESDFFRISSTRVCDGIVDCADGADERKCERKETKVCSDGTYVPVSWLRGKQDVHCFLCNDCNNTNSLTAFKNKETENCTFPPELTYGVTICNETHPNKGETVTHCENKLHRKIWTPSCLYIRRSKDVSLGCPDMSQLQDCQHYICPDDFIKCPHDYCIPVYYINDGIMDCRYGEDETQNVDLNGRGYFMCSSGTIFLHPNNVCDGEEQCLDGEDELNCHAVCPEGFMCEGGVAYDIDAVSMSTKYLDKFKYINVTNRNVIHFSSLLPNVFRLVLSNCSIVYINEILSTGGDYKDKNYYLYFLDLSYNQIQAIDEGSILNVFPNLRFLNLSHNNELHTFKLDESGSKRLNTLDLSYTELSVLHLTFNDENYQMKYLFLYKTEITNLVWLQNIKYVENLDIRGTLITNEVLSPDDLSNVSITVSLRTDSFKLCCPSYRGPGVQAYVCSSPPDAVSSCEDLLSDTVKRALLWIVATSAFVGNIAVIYYRGFHERNVFKKAYGIFVTNLGVSDLLMGAYLIFIAAVDVHYRHVYVINEAHWRHSVLCKAAGFISTLSSETSTFFIFLITVDRFFVMRYPFGHHGFKKWHIAFVVISAWIAGIIMALLPLSFESWELYSSNGLCLGLPLTVSRQYGWPYSFAIFIALNLCMFLVIALGQVAIFRSMSSSRDNLANAHSIDRRAQDVTVAKKLSLIALSNFLCWFPICVMGLRSKFGVEPNPEALAWLLVFVLPLNSAVNPMIYTIPAVYNKWQEFKQAGYRFTRRPKNSRP